MKRFFSILLLALLLAVILIFPTLYIKGHSQEVQLEFLIYASVVSSATSLLLLALALAIYKRFNGSQALVDRQTEKVVGLLNFLNKIRFSIDINENRRSVGSHYNLEIIDYKKRRTELTDNNGVDRRGYSNYASESIVGLFFHLYDLGSDPYLPRPIAKCLRGKFYLGVVWNVEKTKVKSKYILVNARGEFKGEVFRGVNVQDDQFNRGLYDKFDDWRFELEDMMHRLETTHRLCYKWLKDNNKTIFGSLNIDEVMKFNRKHDTL